MEPIVVEAAEAEARFGFGASLVLTTASSTLTAAGRRIDIAWSQSGIRRPDNDADHLVVGASSGGSELSSSPIQLPLNQGHGTNHRVEKRFDFIDQSPVLALSRLGDLVEAPSSSIG